VRKFSQQFFVCAKIFVLFVSYFVNSQKNFAKMRKRKFSFQPNTGIGIEEDTNTVEASESQGPSGSEASTVLGQGSRAFFLSVHGKKLKVTGTCTSTCSKFGSREPMDIFE
jgi:hypothetical protein